MSYKDRIITEAELKKHTSEKDCWMVIGGIVYDLTKFLDDHPGGSDVIVQCSGRDATEDFEDVGHSDAGRQMAEPYAIGLIENWEGDVHGCNKPAKRTSAKKSGSSALPMILMGAVVGLAVYYISM